jgi:hypothetical protein
MLLFIIRAAVSYPFLVLGKAINDFGRMISGVTVPVSLAIAYHPRLGFCLKRSGGQISSWQNTPDEAFRILHFEVDKSQQEMCKPPA